MVPLGVDPEGVPTPAPTYTPAPTPTPVSALLLMNFFGTPAFAFRTYRVWKSICFFEHLCLEIACEEIPGPGSYKDKPQIVEGPQCIIYNSRTRWLRRCQGEERRNYHCSIWILFNIL